MEHRKLSSAGFTLLELLVVLAIVGALIAIAIPGYSSYRAKAYDLRAELDLRNIALAEEAYFLDAEKYLSCQNDACKTLPGIRRLSQGVTLAISATTSGFTGTSTHPLGRKILRWDSSQGGLLE